jgi:hypothetical protein
MTDFSSISLHKDSFDNADYERQARKDEKMEELWAKEQNRLHSEQKKDQPLTFTQK